ncbi:MAG: hypothetical protein JJV93_01910 [Alphaproteobacteria bacterium]|nr:hypothetical protein [Alphaproteobacteria bacterium]
MNIFVVLTLNANTHCNKNSFDKTSISINTFSSQISISDKPPVIASRQEFFGATSTSLTEKVKINLVKVDRCWFIKSIKLDIGFPEFKVFVKPEFHTTCLNTQILKHEQKHILIYKQVLEENVSKLKKDLELFIRQSSPAIGSPNDIVDQYYTQLNGFIPYIITKKNINFNAISRNRQLDDDENSKDIIRLCP